MYEVAPIERPAKDAIERPGQQPLPAEAWVIPERADAVARFQVVRSVPALAAQPALFFQGGDLVPQLNQLTQDRVFTTPGLRMQIDDAHTILLKKFKDSRSTPSNIAHPRGAPERFAALRLRSCFRPSAQRRHLTIRPRKYIL
jgi:hypothetical protein